MKTATSSAISKFLGAPERAIRRNVYACTSVHQNLEDATMAEAVALLSAATTVVLKTVKPNILRLKLLSEFATIALALQMCCVNVNITAVRT